MQEASGALSSNGVVSAVPVRASQRTQNAKKQGRNEPLDSVFKAKAKVSVQLSENSNWVLVVASWASYAPRIFGRPNCSLPHLDQKITSCRDQSNFNSGVPEN